MAAQDRHGASSVSSPVFVDLEASALIFGFPIEVGWAHVREGDVVSEGHLVRPADSWLADHTRWAWQSELVHRIPLRDCLSYGIPCADLAVTLNRVLGPVKEVFSDAPSYDQAWMGLLFEEAGVPQAFVIRDVALAFSGPDTDETLFQTLERQFHFRPRPHRAAADAAQWAHLWHSTRRRNGLCDEIALK